MKIFVSYSSQNRAAVKALVTDLGSLGHAAWFDQELDGGQVWWDTILDQIRACDLFILALTGATMKSGPCKLEYTYAYELGKPILPVMLSDDVVISLLPVILQERQFVNYINQDKAALLALNGAIQSTPPAPPLPDPLPDPPAVPISPLAELQAEVERHDLSYEQQLALFHRIKDFADQPSYRRDALALMAELEQHPALLAAVFKEINAFLSVAAPDRAPLSQPAPEPESEPVPGPPLAPAPLSDDLARIVIQRPAAFEASVRAYQIVLDGQKVGEVRNNAERVFDVAPGAHTVYIQMDWLKSQEHHLQLGPGETVMLRAKWSLGLLGGKLLLEPTAP